MVEQVCPDGIALTGCQLAWRWCRTLGVKTLGEKKTEYYTFTHTSQGHKHGHCQRQAPSGSQSVSFLLKHKVKTPLPPPFPPPHPVSHWLLASVSQSSPVDRQAGFQRCEREITLSGFLKAGMADSLKRVPPPQPPIPCLYLLSTQTFLFPP